MKTDGGCPQIAALWLLHLSSQQLLFQNLVNFIHRVDAMHKVQWRIGRKGEAVYHVLLHIVFGERPRLCFCVIQT